MDEADDTLAHPENSLNDRKPSRWRRRATVFALLALLVAAGLVLPGLVNIGRYKRQIAGLMSRSMGRPVRMSGVELRLLPTPGFVLHDLAVTEDPQFGAEPILSARTVVASVRFLSLLTGRIEISQVSVDEASLNLVRSAQGRWNLESLMMGSQPEPAGTGAGRHLAGVSARFPYLEATASRVNLKNGAEKSPFSVVETDLSLWQDAPGQWRVRLRGQPMRTDIPMSLADTGEVRLEASLNASPQSAAQLRDMPLKLDMEWRNAHLGQLSRLLTGSDAGWRGDLTADIAVEGTPESAQTKARLRATGVRRAEFAPNTPLDFDANCSFRYEHTLNAAHDVDCNTAIGDGQLQLKAQLPGRAEVDGKPIPPEATLEVKDVPLQAGLDLLRTVRSGFAPGIAARGSVNGSLTYRRVPGDAMAAAGKRTPSARRKGGPAGSQLAAAPSDLRGTLTVSGAELSGGGLPEALKLPEFTLAPAMAGRPALAANFTVPLGKAAEDSGPAPDAAVTLSLDREQYQVEIKGTSALETLRELGYSFGWPRTAEADAFEGGMADFDVTARAPWIAAGDEGSFSPFTGTAPVPGTTNFSEASLTLHQTRWHMGYLLHPVELLRASVRLGGTGLSLESDFTYGKGNGRSGIAGSATVNVGAECAAPGGGDACLPQVAIRFGALDGAAVESALLGTAEEKSLLSGLMDRMRSADQPKWPPVALRVQAESLVLGPATLQKPAAEIRFEQGVAVLKHWEVRLLGGSGDAAGTGRFGWADGKPQYAFDGSFTHLGGAQLGALIGGGSPDRTGSQSSSGWAGGPVDGTGSVELSGRTGADLAASATGTVHFDWQHGAGLAVGDGAAMRFDDWSGTAAIHAGTLELGQNSLRFKRKLWVLAGTIPFSGPAKLTAAPADGKPDVTAAGPKQAVR